MEKMSILELSNKVFTLEKSLREVLVDDESYWKDYIDVHETVYNYRDPEHRFLVTELGRISDNLIEAHKKLEYLKKQAKTPQSLHKNERGRYETENREYTCGDRVEYLADIRVDNEDGEPETMQEWRISRIEHDGNDYYIVGNSSSLEGILVRERE